MRETTVTNLTSSQKWVLVAFIASILSLGTTFFLQGDVRIFAYIIISMGVAAYAILGKDKSRKAKNDS
jgi:hypothetical protein